MQNAVARLHAVELFIISPHRCRAENHDERLQQITPRLGIHHAAAWPVMNYSVPLRSITLPGGVRFTSTSQISLQHGGETL